MTFLEIVHANGFESINAYLDAMEGAFENLSDLSETQMRRIRRNEAASEVYVGAVA